MLYPVSVIDGLVHQLGGPKLMLECKMINLFKGGCPVGTAVETSPGSEELQRYYDRIIHCTPPFYKYYEDGNPTEALHRCYRSAFDVAFSRVDQVGKCRVAFPLLGAGARGFPHDVAVDVAAEASWKWLRHVADNNAETSYEYLVAFGIPDPDVAVSLAETLNILESQ